MHGAKRNAYRILEGRPKEKRPPGRSRCWWEDNIKIHIWEITDFQENDPIWNLDPLLWITHRIPRFDTVSFMAVKMAALHITENNVPRLVSLFH
jgi:hypothetical protein